MNVLVKLSDRLYVNLAQVTCVEKLFYNEGGWVLWVTGRANAIELKPEEKERLDRCLADIGGKVLDLTDEDAELPERVKCQACGGLSHEGRRVTLGYDDVGPVTCDGFRVFGDAARMSCKPTVVQASTKESRTINKAARDYHGDETGMS